MFAGSLAMGMHAATAQEAGEQPMQRVEITGSSIKRIAAEASLPVQSFSEKDIKKTGVTTVTDFIPGVHAAFVTATVIAAIVLVLTCFMRRSTPTELTRVGDDAAR